MYLSRLLLNPKSVQVWKDLSSPYEAHRTILRAFPSEEKGGPGRVLFRIDPPVGSGAVPVLVQSDLRPDWAQLRVPEEYFLSGENGDSQRIASKEVRLSFHPGDLLRFRLRANPTWRSREGQRLGILEESQQLAWLSRKGESGGFRPLAVLVSVEGMKFVRRGVGSQGQPIRMFSVLYNGRLEVKDPELFVETIANGIGSGKGFGFGLLSIGPP